jgi:hypothetical protein
MHGETMKNKIPVFGDKVLEFEVQEAKNYQLVAVLSNTSSFYVQHWYPFGLPTQNAT